VAPVQEPLYFVAHNGANLTSSPVNADAVRAMPQGLAALLVCIAGTQTWMEATSVIAAPAPAPAPAPVAPVAPAAPAAPAATPPWMQPGVPMPNA
jgi:hypothetical protein